MKLRGIALWLAALAVIAGPALAQNKYVHWSAEMQPRAVRAGEHAQIVLTAKIDAPYHMYSLKVVPDGNIPTTLQLAEDTSLSIDGPPVQPAPRAVHDPNFNNARLEYYEGGVAFGLPVTVKASAAGAHNALVNVRYQICKEGACERPVDFQLTVPFDIQAGTARAEYSSARLTPPAQPAEYRTYAAVSPESGAAPATTVAPAIPSDQTSQQIAEAKRKGILNFLLLSFGFGFAALLTPCVFPMIPITVSFFAKSSGSTGGRPDVRGAFAYSLGIIGTFTGLGLLTTVVFGPAGINRLAQSPWTNLVLAALFITLAANLFGAFEIMVPGWLVDKAQQRKGSGGLLGPMAMGFAFTLTSFTCTVAFVGTLLAAAAQGDWFYPALGMLAFSTAFALPFFLLALFPQYLARLPKSGSWMISVKAFMGFLELAAALKFISNIDLFLQAGILTRPVFLAIWAALGMVAGLYLWGWLRLAVDTSKRFGMARRAIGGFSIAAGAWCLAAINGAPLGTLAAFLPPAPYPYREGRAAEAGDKWIRDWDEARAQARAQNRPIFINFTGAQCTNCRDMEANVLPLPEVSRELDKFIRVELITDQMGERSKRNAKLQDELARVTTLPYFVITNSDGKPVGPPIGYTKDVAYFLRFLREGLAASEPQPQAQGARSTERIAAAR